MRQLLLIFTLAIPVLGQTVIGQTVLGQSGVFQTTNPNYPARNPFYFEGKIDYEKLGIASPANAWEYMQRGIHRQDDLEDMSGAISDYRESVGLNSLEKGSCQLVTTAAGPDFGKLDPPPCLFTVRLRLGFLLLQGSPDEAIALFREVLRIDPRRLEVNSLMGEAYQASAALAQSEGERRRLNELAIAAYRAELELSPVTAETTALTGDEANNAHVHWAMAGILEKLGDLPLAASEYDLYLKATKWHSDVYPWRIPLARKKIEQLHGSIAN